MQTALDTSAIKADMPLDELRVVVSDRANNLVGVVDTGLARSVAPLLDSTTLSSRYATVLQDEIDQAKVGSEAGITVGASTMSASSGNESVTAPESVSESAMVSNVGTTRSLPTENVAETRDATSEAGMTRAVESSGIESRGVGNRVAGIESNPPYDQPPYNQPPYGQSAYNQPPYGQSAYNQPPYAYSLLTISPPIISLRTCNRHMYHHPLRMDSFHLHQHHLHLLRHYRYLVVLEHRQRTSSRAVECSRGIKGNGTSVMRCGISGTSSKHLTNLPRMPLSVTTRPKGPLLSRVLVLPTSLSNN